MSRIKQTPTIEVKLSEEDNQRFDQLCRVQAKRKAQLMRESVRWYMDHHDKLNADSRENLLERRMRKMEERMAALQARTAIDVGMIYHLIYRNMDLAKRDEVIAWAYNSAVQRLKKRLAGQAGEIKELMQKQDDKVSSQA